MLLRENAPYVLTENIAEGGNGVTVQDASEMMLRVAEGLIEDVRKGIVRIDSYDLEKIGAKMGDIIEIQGGRTTVAKVMPAFAEHSRKEIIQMDGIIRDNARVGIDETVIVRKVSTKQARTVVLSPLESGRSYDKEQQLKFIRSLITGLPVIVGDKIMLKLFGTREEGFRVEGTAPKGPVIVTKETTVRVKTPDVLEEQSYKVSYEDIGGLDKEVQKVREIIELPLKYPDVFRQLGIEAPKGVLLHGPPGTGKTLIARAVASETEAYFIHVNGPEIMHKYYGESEAKLREVFDEARKHAPSILFLDEIDALAPKRQEVHGDVEKRVVAQLLALMDGLESRGEVVVIGATNIPDMVDGALRRPGRFDREIAINAPDKNGRLHILKIHTRGMTLAEDVSLDRLAQVTHGFVGADLANLCKEAGMYAVRRILPQIEFGGDKEQELQVEVTMEDFQQALAEADPSATREFFTDIPEVSWEDVGGLDHIKEKLITLVEWPLKYGDLFNRLKMTAAKGILLSGPTGTGKTLVAKALARESEVNFISVASATLFSRWIGESEKALHEVFKKAKQASPCILFFDEIDALTPHRSGTSSTSNVSERMVSQFLTELDGLEELKGVIVLAATNRIDALDPALLRPGRFDYIVDFPIPDFEQRLKIFEVHLKNKPLARDVNLHLLAEMTQGMVGSDIDGICKKASYLAIGDYIAGGYALHQEAMEANLILRKEHFDKAIHEVNLTKSIKAAC